jgi:hypothetical protein
MTLPVLLFIGNIKNIAERQSERYDLSKEKVTSSD